MSKQLWHIVVEADPKNVAVGQDSSPKTIISEFYEESDLAFFREKKLKSDIEAFGNKSENLAVYLIELHTEDF